jgi:hypothetical protein
MKERKVTYDYRSKEAGSPIKDLLDAGLGRVPGDLLSMVEWAEKTQYELRVKITNHRKETDSEVKAATEVLDKLLRDPSTDDDLKAQLVPVKFALLNCSYSAQQAESSVNAAMVHLLHTFSGVAKGAKEALKAVQRAYKS